MKIVEEFVWNNTNYTLVEYDDGTRIEIRGPSDTALEKAAALLAYEAEEPPDIPVVQLSEITDKELVVEIKKRKISLVAVGRAI